MSMRHAVMINCKLFLVHMIEVENLILSSTQVLLIKFKEVSLA